MQREPAREWMEASARAPLEDEAGGQQRLAGGTRHGDRALPTRVVALATCSAPPGAQGASGPTWLRKRSTALVAGGENDARVFVPAPTPSSGLGAKPTTLTVFVVLTTTSSGAAAVASPWPPADISFDMGAHDQVELGGGARNNGGSARGWRSQLPLQLSRVHRRRCRHNMRGRTRYFTRYATPRAAPHATQQRLRVSGIKVATLLPAAARATVADVSSERS